MDTYICIKGHYGGPNADWVGVGAVIQTYIEMRPDLWEKQPEKVLEVATPEPKKRQQK